MSVDEEIQSLLDQGLVQYGLGDVESALRCWKRVIQIDPQNAKAIEYLSFVEENRRTPTADDTSNYRPDETTDPNSPPLKQIRRQKPAQSTGHNRLDEIFDPKPPQVQKRVWEDLYSQVSESDESSNSFDAPLQIPLDPAIAVQPPTDSEMNSEEQTSTLPPLPSAQVDQELDLDISLDELSQEITIENKSQEITLEYPYEEITEESPLLTKEPLEIEISIEEEPVEANGHESQSRDPNSAHAKSAFGEQPALVHPPQEDLCTKTPKPKSHPSPTKITPKAPFLSNESGNQPQEKTTLQQNTQTDSALEMVSATEDTQKTVEVAIPGLESLLQGARDMLGLDDFTGVLEILEKIDETYPDHPEAQNMRQEAEDELLGIFSSKLGDLSKIPSICMNQDEIIWLNLDHKAGFLLSLIDGSTSFENILDLSGLSKLEGMRILVNLLQEKVIQPSA